MEDGKIEGSSASQGESTPKRASPRESQPIAGAASEREQISKKEIESAIKQSGYLLEQRVLRFFSENGFHVETNAAFQDEITGKSREYDGSAFIVFDMLGRSGFIDHYAVHILCECENNEQPVVFFASDFQAEHLFHDGIKFSGLPISVRQGRRLVGISTLLQFEKFHHFWKWPIATQYCSFHRKNRQSPWLASHDEAHHNTLSTLVGATENSINEHYQLLATWLPMRTTQVRAHSPLLVLGGDIYLAQESDTGDLEIRESNFVQYRKEMWFRGKSRVYHLDVIRESFLAEYLEMVFEEIDQVRKRSARNRKKIVSALHADVRRFVSTKKVRDLREFLEAAQ